MRYIRLAAVIVLIFIMGYLSLFGLFADSDVLSSLILIVIFVVGSAGVGGLIPKYWYLSGLCSWGAILLTVLEIGFRIGRAPVPGQQSLAQLILTALGVIGLALLGGYIGFRVLAGSNSSAGR